MKALGEAVASLKAGVLPTKAGNLPARSAGTMTGFSEPPIRSAITGLPLRADQLSSEIGRLLGATGAAALMTNDPALPWQAGAVLWLANICEQPNVLRSCIAEARQAIRDFLMPAPEDQLTARVTGLLAHYFDPNIGEDVRTIVLWDWCRMLGGYPMWAIESAADQWLSKEHRKPTPRMILDLIPYAARSPAIRSLTS